MEIKDIYYDNNGVDYLKDALNSSWKTEKAVLVYRNKKKNRESPFKKKARDESLLESDYNETTPVKLSVDVDSMCGSPLKLEQFDMECHLVEGTGEVLPSKVFTSNEYGVRIPGVPLDVLEARFLLSNKQNEHSNTTILVYCNGSDPDGVVLLGSKTKINEDTESEVIHTYKVTSKGPYTSKEQFPKIASIAKKHFPQSAKIKTKCFAEYDVFGSQGRDLSVLQQRGMLKIKLEWDKGTSLLQNPPLDSKTTVEVSVSEGDMRSAAYSMYTELVRLQGLTHGIDENYVDWAVEKEDQPMITRLKRMLDDLKQGDYGKKNTEDDEAQSPLKGLVFGCKDLDFTEELWNVLKDCSCYKDLVEGLDLVLSYLKNGQIQPMVHKSNQSHLAQLVRDSYYSKMVMPSLEGRLPLQILVEIGTEKLQRDYTNAFIGSDLVTGSHLEYFLKSGSTYKEKVNNLSKLHTALEVAVMLEQHLNLPKATLSMSARQALTYYESNELEEDHIFTVPVQTNCIAEKIERYQVSMWKIDVYSTIDKHEVCTSYVLTTRPIFNHVHRDITLGTGTDKDSLHYYLTTESESVVVL